MVRCVFHRFGQNLDGVGGSRIEAHGVANGRVGIYSFAVLHSNRGQNVSGSECGGSGRSVIRF